MEIPEILQNIHFSSILWQIIAPLIFSVADILTGYISAIINKEVDSRIMREGLLHKFLLIIIMLLSFVMDFAFNLKVISVSVCAYICVIEIMSILENLQKAGIDIKINFIKKGDEKNEIK